MMQDLPNYGCIELYSGGCQLYSAEGPLYQFLFWTENVFLKLVKLFLSQNGRMGSLLVNDWLHSV
jgi:hypothetical protein